MTRKRTIRTGSRALIVYPEGDVDYGTVTALEPGYVSLRVGKGRNARTYVTVPEDIGIGVDDDIVAEYDRRSCYCIHLFTDHRVGDEGCEFNADWTAR